MNHTTSTVAEGATSSEGLRSSGMSATLTATDIEKSLAWYRDVAGFTVEQTHERDGALVAVTLRAGDARLVLGRDDGARGFDRVKGEGFSLHFSTDQDIDELADGIRKRGGTLLSEPVDSPWGVRVFRLQDPDGFKLAISAPVRREA